MQHSIKVSLRSACANSTFLYGRSTSSFLGIAKLVAWVRHLLFLVKVEGESAWPFLVPGRVYYATRMVQPRVGDFIVFSDPRLQERTLVKRIQNITDEGYNVAGTVSWGSTSQDFGIVPFSACIGKIIFHA